MARGPRGNDTVYTMRALNIMLYVFALNCPTRSRSSLQQTCSLVRTFATALMLGGLTAYTAYYKVAYLYDGVGMSIKYPDMVQVLFDYCQYIVDLVFVYTRGRRLYLEYLNYYAQIDAMLGIKDPLCFKKSLDRWSAVIVLVSLFAYAADLVSWAFSFGWATSSVYAITSIYSFIKVINILDLCSQIVNIEYRLRVLCDFLQDFYCNSADNLASIHFSVDPVANRNWLHYNANTSGLKDKGRLQYLKSTMPNMQQSPWLSKCYLLLLEQACYINYRYGIRMLLCVLSNLIDMVRFTVLAMRIFTRSQYTKEGYEFITATPSLIKVCLYAMLLVYLAYRCQGCYGQGHRIVGIIDYMLVNKKIDTDFKEYLTEFRGLVLSRPVTFHMANFFTLDYAMLASIASVVVTYSIILQSLNN